jgi:putative membrane protein
MVKFFLRLAINAVALYAALALMRGHGIEAQSTFWLSIVLLALVFGIVNAILGPIVRFLTCPLVILTLGLGTLLINTLLFYLAGSISTFFGFGFRVEGFWPAFLGALIVSVVSFFLNMIFKDELRKDQ